MIKITSGSENFGDIRENCTVS